VPRIGWIRDSFKSLTPAPILWESGSAEEAQVASLFACSWAAPIREMFDQGCKLQKGGRRRRTRRNATEERETEERRKRKITWCWVSSLLFLHGRHSLTELTN
jgi:hypothetical protein